MCQHFIFYFGKNVCLSCACVNSYLYIYIMFVCVCDLPTVHFDPIIYSDYNELQESAHSNKPAKKMPTKGEKKVR